MEKQFLYIFNPDHDLALANNDPNYMPPVLARRLADDLALFPAWFALPDSKVLAASAYNHSFLNEQKKQFPALADIITQPEVCQLTDPHPVPWGWDPAIRKRFLLSGIPQQILPDDERMAKIRQLSDRTQATALLPLLQFNDNFCGSSFALTNISELRYFVEKHPLSILKAPLSGSGKGLYWCKGIFTPHICGWCENILHQQGAVIAEPVYDKVLDFAMQFRISDDLRASFSGYSLFKTTTNGAYEGNLLVSDEEIEKILSKYVSLTELDKLKEQLQRYLTTHFKEASVHYLGIDMMICRFPEAPHYRIHPCVEINLRMNMGMASRLICDNFVAPCAKGRFRIDYYPSPQLLIEDHKRLSEAHKPVIENGRIQSGYLPLVPVTPQSRYSARILIGGNLENT